jgi:tRNA(Ile)-lysidine synthase
VGSADDLTARVRASGLLPAGEPVLVLLSGGRDSVCLLDLAVRLAGAGATRALHVNYGLREAADADEAACRALCAALGVPLHAARPRGRPRGNLQAWARHVRYAEAERLARAHGARIAAGHTASDQVETVLYRLAASPGRCALLGMPAREGRLVRPLLGTSREETAAYCRERGLTWREDASNASPAFARNRARHELLPALRSLHPAAEANVLRTLALLRDEAAILDATVADALERAGDPPRAEALATLPPALGRLALQAMADAAARGGRAPAVGHRLDEVLALAARGGSRSLDLGGGLEARAEYGRLRVERHGPEAARPEPAPAPAPILLDVPGRARFAGGVLTSELGRDLPVGEGVLAAAAVAAPLEARPWRPGDRMRPLGLGGSRSLQDLFTDRKVPRARRHELPVVLSGGEIAWVPGVATGERFRVTDPGGERVRLAWRAPSGHP